MYSSDVTWIRLKHRVILLDEVDSIFSEVYTMIYKILLVDLHFHFLG